MKIILQPISGEKDIIEMCRIFVVNEKVIYMFHMNKNSLKYNKIWNLQKHLMIKMGCELYVIPSRIAKM